MADAVPAEKTWHGGSVECLVNWGMSHRYVRKAMSPMSQWFILAIYIYIYTYTSIWPYIVIIYIYIYTDEYGKSGDGLALLFQDYHVSWEKSEFRILSLRLLDNC